MEGNLKGNYLRLMPGRQNELVGKFKMAAGDMVRTYTYIPIGIYTCSYKIFYIIEQTKLKLTLLTSFSQFPLERRSFVLLFPGT